MRLKKIFAILTLIFFVVSFVLAFREPLSLVILCGLALIIINFSDKIGAMPTCIIMSLWCAIFLIYLNSINPFVKSEKSEVFSQEYLMVKPEKNDDGVPLYVPSDAKAKYTVLNKSSDGAYRIITTRRDGSSGITYSKRIYDCAGNKTKYLGTGDSLTQMENSTSDPSMYEIVENSIAFYVGKEACK